MDINKIDEDIVKQISTMAVAYSDVRLYKADVDSGLRMLMRSSSNRNISSDFAEDMAAMCLLWLQYNKT